MPEDDPADRPGDGATDRSVGDCSRTSTSTLSIDIPDAALRDERFVPRITGLEHGQRATLTAAITDGDRRWRSTATFEADDGAIDLSSAAPVAGSYDRVDAMGPIWSMTPDNGDNRFRPDPSEPYEVRFTARADDKTVTATVEIRHTTPGVESHTITEADVFGTWYEPAGDGKHPAVVFLHGSAGNVMRAEAALLASRGVATLALRYLGAGDLPNDPVGVPLEYVESAISWFLDRDAVAGGSVGLYGVSMGGQLALLLATRDDRVDAVVSDAGSFHVTGRRDQGAWTEGGESIPYLVPPDESPDRYISTVDGAPVLRDLSVQLLTKSSASARRDATIPLEDAAAPILLLSGSDDRLWPATAFANAAVARLDALGYEYPYDHRAYHDAGHAIGTPYRPTAWRPVRGGSAKGGTPAAQARAQADAWPRMVEFFGDALGGDSTEWRVPEGLRSNSETNADRD